jgi:tetratricopeptide (TPR) repeat protein
MTPLSNDARPTCACGSGLTADRCCALDWTAAWPAPVKEPEVAEARAAQAAGNVAVAERLLVGVLGRSPLHVGALALLADICTSLDKKGASEALLKRIVRLDPNHLPATQALALLLFSKGALTEAEIHARNAVRIAPLDAQSHNLMGMIMTEAHRPHVGEHHYRRARELLRHPSAILTANLAWHLKNQGRIVESRELYQQSVALDPNLFQTLYGWAQMEETDRNFARAAELLDAAEKQSPGDPRVLLERAVLHGRVKAYDAAVATLEDIEKRHADGLGPLAESEMGMLLDKMGRHAAAFAAFSAGKRKLRELTCLAYQADEASTLAERLKGFFVAGRLKILPRAGVRSDVAQLIFIVGCACVALRRFVILRLAAEAEIKVVLLLQLNDDGSHISA